MITKNRYIGCERFIEIKTQLHQHYIVAAPGFLIQRPVGARRLRGGGNFHRHHRHAADAPPPELRVHAGADRGDLLHLRALLRRPQRRVHDHAREVAESRLRPSAAAS